MIRVFYLENSLSYPDKIMIKVDPEKFHISNAKGSLNVMAARVLSLSYANYCRMCRDVFGAELHGRNEVYLLPIFKDAVAAHKLCELLNIYATLILWERERPDWEKHAEELKK